MMSLTGIKPKEVRALIREWVSRGAVVTTTRSNHLRIDFPNGKHIRTSLTSSDRRVVNKIRSDARKYADWE
jgi:hypothetical protein